MLIFTFLSLAIAQNHEPKANIQNVDFDGVELKGELRRPSGTIVNERPPSQFSPITDLRIHFHTELQQSVHAIQ